MSEVINMPKLSDTMEEGVIAKWTKKEGDFVEEGDLIAEIESDKATQDFESPEEGVILKLIAQPGEPVPIGEPMMVLGEKGEKFDAKDLKIAKKTEPAPKPVQEVEKKEEPLAAKQSKSSESSVLKASPLAKKIAQTKNINLADVKGSGPNGRVIKRDIVNLGQNSGQGLRVSAPSDQKIPLTMIRKTIAKRLLKAKNDAPHFYLTRTIDMENLLNWRKELKKLNAKDMAPKISVNDLLVLAVAKALRRHPQVNSAWMDDHILQYGAVNVAIAVAIPSGLITPVVPNTDQLGLYDLAKVTKTLIQRAFDNDLSPEEYNSGTFTISNLGMYNIDEFTAIINPPQSAILAVGSTKAMPVVNDKNEVVVRRKMKVTLSCDHRSVDGSVGALFLQTLADNLENPEMMLV